MCPVGHYPSQSEVPIQNISNMYCLNRNFSCHIALNRASLNRWLWSSLRLKTGLDFYLSCQPSLHDVTLHRSCTNCAMKCISKHSSYDNYFILDLKEEAKLKHNKNNSRIHLRFTSEATGNLRSIIENLRDISRGYFSFLPCLRDCRKGLGLRNLVKKEGRRKFKDSGKLLPQDLAAYLICCISFFKKVFSQCCEIFYTWK